MTTDVFANAGGNVAGLLAAAARNWPSGKATGRTQAQHAPLSWAQLNRAVDARAHDIAAAGVDRGERVATLLPTSVEFVVNFLAILRAGAVAVPLAPQLGIQGTRGLLEHSGARLLIAGETAIGTLPDQVRVIGPEWADAEVTPVDAAATGEDTAMLAYVAGVDSAPRAAVYSHRALLANAEQLRQVLPGSVAGHERVALGAPLAHIYTLVAGLLPAVSAGWTVLLPTDPGADTVLADCAADRATMLVGSPAMYAELSALGDERLGDGLATVSHLLCGPTPAHSRVHAAMRRATGLELAQCYGRAEVAGVLSSTLAAGGDEPGSVGAPLPGCELRLLDSAGGGEPVPDDPNDPGDVFSDDGSGTGLIAARGPSLSSGYWPSGEYGPDAGGWARTGDVGYFDGAGQLHLVDRASDLIVLDGFNVYPHEIEQVIGELPEVAEVAVVGVRADSGAESVHAVVVAVPGVAVTEERVLEQCAAKLPAYKVPAAVRFAGELPHTPTGMLRRNRVR